jgi:hypothetical protein
MKAIADNTVSQDADKVGRQFQDLLAKVNKESPKSADVEAFSSLLYKNKGMELWKTVRDVATLAEDSALAAISANPGSGSGIKECWRQGLESMRADLGYASSPPLEQILIRQVTLCWLNLNLTEHRFTKGVRQPITLNVGLYWERRLSAAQQRFTRACESLARVRRLTRRIPIQVNIAAAGGQQINVTAESLTTEGYAK